MPHAHAQDVRRVVVPFHSCKHLVQLCNGEFGLMNHMGDRALIQRMADNVCVCVFCQCFLGLCLLFLFSLKWLVS